MYTSIAYPKHLIGGKPLFSVRGDTIAETMFNANAAAALMSLDGDDLVAAICNTFGQENSVLIKITGSNNTVISEQKIAEAG